VQPYVPKMWAVFLFPYGDQITIGVGHDAIRKFDDVYHPAERGIDRRHLQTDDAPADDEKRAGAGGKFERGGGIEDSRIVRQQRQPRRFAAHRDDTVLVGDLCFAVVHGNNGLRRTAQTGAAMYGPDLPR